MELLSRSLVESGISVEHNAGDFAALPEKVLQFGEGNFLRAFVDWMLDLLNEKNMFGGRAVVVQPLADGLVDMLNQQEGLYTLLLQGIENGEVVDKRRVITSISRGLNPYSEWESYLATAENPKMELIVSNTTEAGIEYREEELVAGKCPDTFPAKITAWLYKRYTVFSGAADKGMVVLPCELINYNGTALKECILKYSRLWKLEEGFAAWIEESNTFLSTLVDRIVPGYPRDKISEIITELGYKDNLVDTGEIFHLLVIEGADKRVREMIPLDKAGLNVVFTDDMQPYRTRKVAILNGGHTGNVLGAYLGGLETVGEMLADEDYSAFLKGMLLDEIVPVLNLPDAEKKSYAEAILERFSNPFVRHELLTISLNSVSKWKVRVLPSLKKYIAKNNSVPARLAFSLAALIIFYNGNKNTDGEFVGNSAGREYVIKDNASVVDFFAATHKLENSAEIAQKVLGNIEFWGEDLNELVGLTQAVENGLEGIRQHGCRESVKAFNL